MNGTHKDFRKHYRIGCYGKRGNDIPIWVIEGCYSDSFISKWCYISDILKQTLEAKDVDLEQEIQQHINDCLDIKFPTTDIKIMEQYISKSALVAEIERLISNGQVKLHKSQESNDNESYVAWAEHIATCIKILSVINSIEVKEVDLNNGIQLTWEDIRELYIIFAEVDIEIELCKTDIKTETLGYYQEVLKRFKTQKGE